MECAVSGKADYIVTGDRPPLEAWRISRNLDLQCSESEKADYIVSGDRHLLKLGVYQGILICSVRKFLDSIPDLKP